MMESLPVIVYAIRILFDLGRLIPKETKMRMVDGVTGVVAEASQWFAHESRLAAWVLSLTEVLAWYDNKVMTRFTLDRLDHTWRLMVKAYSRKAGGGRQHWVAFYECATAADCFKVFAAEVKADHISWFEDRHPPNMAD